MTTVSSILGQTGFHAPRLTWRTLVKRIMALDTLHRERAQLSRLDAHTLRDIGAIPEDIGSALARADDHLALILGRCVH